jgi:phosphopantothenoylcysteine decarboxylase/phosphopantothenate--cysteine ligase
LRHSPSQKKNPVKILVTAGPTVEPLDPVRYISNFSTGAMGYEIARAGVDAGYDVCLVSGPSQLEPPQGAETIRVKTASEMKKHVMKHVKDSDCVIMAAAVCDFKPARREKHKIKKKKGEITVKMKRTPDILAGIGRRRGLIKIGFALETKTPRKSGQEKLEAKDLDLIVVNARNSQNDPFGPDSGKRFQYEIIGRGGDRRGYRNVTKKSMAKVIIKEAGRMIGLRQGAR